MCSKLKILVLLASFFLVSCAPQTVYVASNPVKNERLSSARVVFEVPPQMQIVYGVHPTGSNELAVKNALNHIKPLVKAMQDYVPPQVVSALSKKGISSGAGAIIYLRPVAGYATANNGTMVRLEMSVQSSDRSKWTANILDGSAVGSGTGETNAKVFTDRIIFELVKAGFVPE